MQFVFVFKVILNLMFHVIFQLPIEGVDKTQ